MWVSGRAKDGSSMGCGGTARNSYVGNKGMKGGGMGDVDTGDMKKEVKGLEKLLLNLPLFSYFST